MALSGTPSIESSIALHDKLRRVARYHRWLVIAGSTMCGIVLLYSLLLSTDRGPEWFLMSLFVPPMVVLYLIIGGVVYWFSVISVVLLAKELSGGYFATLCAFLAVVASLSAALPQTPIPIVATCAYFLLMVAYCVLGTRYLKKHGVAVGLLGASSYNIGDSLNNRRTKSAIRFPLAAGLFGAGCLILAIGFHGQNQNESYTGIMLPIILMAIGASMIGAGISLPFARPFTVAAIAVATPCLGLCYLAAICWSVMFANQWPSKSLGELSGYHAIPEARQIDDLFGPAWHQLVNYEEPNIADWQTQAMFGGRYELWMHAKVEIDRQSGEGSKVVGEPQFDLIEVTGIAGRGIIYGGDNHEFGVEEWQKVVAADGDFSVTGIQLTLDNPVPGFAEYEKRPRGGIQMRTEQ